ncbi:MAG: hypothetical protein Gyms2KO_17450 [Gymnodinialimonas sp.]
MGTPYSQKYIEFRDELETILRDTLGADPRILGKNEYPTGSPLLKIKEVMSDCDGVLVVAYERKFVEVGAEKRSAANETPINERTYTTPWNHIESAMAFSLGIPLYVICEKGLKEEGLIESKLDWYVQYLDFSRESLRSNDVLHSLQSWVSGACKRRRKTSTESLLGRVRLSEMTPAEMFGVVSVLATVFLSGLAVGRWFSATNLLP